MNERKTAASFAVVALFAAVLAAGMAFAGNAYAQGRGLAEETGLPPDSRKIDIPAAAPTPLIQILELARKELGINLTATPELEEEKVKLFLVGVRWRKALEEVAERVGGQLITVDTNWLKIVPMPKVTIKMQEADLALVLDQLANLSGANIVIAPDVKGKVSINLRNVPWRTAFDTIIKTLGYVVVEEDYNILRVVRPETLQAQLETKMFQLRYVRPPDQYMAQLPSMGGGAADRGGNFFLSGAAAPRGRGIDDFTLLKVLRNVLTANVGKLEYDYDKNSIIVSDTKPKLKEMEELIAKIDTAPQQVSIEIKFIRTTSINLFEHGIRFNDATTPEEEGGIIEAYFPLPAGGSSGGTYDFDLGRWETIRDDFNAIGRLDFTQTRMMLRLIEADDNSRVIQSPSITITDNQEAVIFVGESVPYVQQNATVDQSGNVTVTISEDPKSPISIGFTLFVTPHVIKETNEIYLTIIPKTNALTGTSSPDNPGFERFSAQLAAGVTTYLDLPRTLDQTIVTKMLLKDGNTAVIGGLLTQRKIEKESRIPFFSAIPFIGGLFRWKRQEDRTENLVIFITPRLIKTSEEHLSRTEDQLRTLKRVDYFYYKYRSNAAAQLEAKLREERAKAEEAKAAAARAEEQKKKGKAKAEK
jgi:type IV pilus assembly protein PilQ